MNGHGLLNTSSPKFDRAAGQRAGVRARRRGRPAGARSCRCTAPPVDSWTMRPVPSRSAATVSVSLPASRVGRAASSLMCTWITAAPAASHSLAVIDQLVQGDRERPAQSALSASAPVGATVIRVRCHGYGHYIQLARLSWHCRPDGQVVPGEGERLGQVGRRSSLLGARRVLTSTTTAAVAAAAQVQQLGAGLGAPAGDQVLVRQPAVLVPSAMCTWASRAEFGGHGQGVGPGHGGVRQVQGGVPDVDLGRVPVRRVRRPPRRRGPQRVHVLHREDARGLLRHRGQARSRSPWRSPAASGTAGARRPPRRRVRPRLGPAQLPPRLPAPHPLGDQQAGRVHGQHRDLVVVREPASTRRPG